MGRGIYGIYGTFSIFKVYSALAKRVVRLLKKYIEFLRNFTTELSAIADCHQRYVHLNKNSSDMLTFTYWFVK